MSIDSYAAWLRARRNMRARLNAKRRPRKDRDEPMQRLLESAMACGVACIDSEPHHRTRHKAITLGLIAEDLTITDAGREWLRIRQAR